MNNGIHAYTEPSRGYPAYVNLSEDAKGVFVLTVRSANTTDGASSSINLTREQLLELVNDASQHLDADVQPAQKDKAIAANHDAECRRFHVLDMALRTPGLKGHDEVMKAARAYQAHIEGEKTTTALPASHPVQQLADAIGGTIEHVERLPDGSGAAVMSMPLPTNHWLTQPGYNVPPMKFRMGADNPSRKGWEEDIRAAGRYAVRCATMNGTEDDFDPDALVQNLVVGMLGYFTPTGLSDDADANPPGVTA